jgi:hypothetical protein
MTHKNVYDESGLCFECYATRSTPSKKAKELGLKSLTQVSELTGQSLQTLTNWFNDKPELFEVVLLGCAAKLGLVT